VNENIAIDVRGLTNAFGTQMVHSALDLQVKRGEIMGVVGGSGSGKSVLMRAILGLRRPQAGSVDVSNAKPACCSKVAPCFLRSPYWKTLRCP